MDINAILDALAGFGWGTLIVGGILSLAFLGVFVWFAIKIFKQFNKF